MALTCITLPKVEPVTVAELKGYLHINTEVEDELIGHLIRCARQSG